MENNIVGALKTMGINVSKINFNQKLDVDLGMDSREIVEFHSVLEKELLSKLPRGIFSKEMTLGVIVKKIEYFLKNNEMCNE